MQPGGLNAPDGSATPSRPRCFRMVLTAPSSVVLSLFQASATVVSSQGISAEYVGPEVALQDLVGKIRTVAAVRGEAHPLGYVGDRVEITHDPLIG